MDIVKLAARKVFGICSCVQLLIRRLLCFLNRRKGDEHGVPISSDSHHHVVPMEESAWDSFDPVVNKQQRMIQDFYKQRADSTRRSSEKDANEPDFFSEMQLQPSVIKTKRIVLKKKSEPESPTNPALRFNVDASSVVPNLNPVLGDLPEQRAEQPTDSWDFEEENVNPDELLKQQRQKEREARRQQRLTTVRS